MHKPGYNVAMKLSVTRLSDGGYEIEDLSGTPGVAARRKERATNVLEMEESLLRHNFTEAEVRRVVKQLEQQPAVTIVRD